MFPLQNSHKLYVVYITNFQLTKHGHVTAYGLLSQNGHFGGGRSESNVESASKQCCEVGYAPGSCFQTLRYSPPDIEVLTSYDKGQQTEPSN